MFKNTDSATPEHEFTKEINVGMLDSRRCNGGFSVHRSIPSLKPVGTKRTILVSLQTCFIVIVVDVCCQY